MIKEDDTGRTDDPVRMYLKEMGNVELLSRVGEIEIAKRIESGKKKRQMLFQKVLFQWNQFSISITITVMAINNLRDFIDLDATFRSVNGEHDEFQDISIKDDEIFEDQEDEENNDKENEDEAEFENENSEDANEASDLSILEKEENLKPHITDKLEKFSQIYTKI